MVVVLRMVILPVVGNSMISKRIVVGKYLIFSVHSLLIILFKFRSSIDLCKNGNFLYSFSVHGFIINLEDATSENSDFRRVLYTAKHSQLVLMSIEPEDEIGEEVHGLDQFIRVESGEGKVILDGAEHPIGDGDGVVIPAGTRHNIINTSQDVALKLYTIYSPPEHRDGVIHATKADALADTTDEFDGKTTE